MPDEVGVSDGASGLVGGTVTRDLRRNLWRDERCTHDVAERDAMVEVCCLPTGRLLFDDEANIG